MQQLHENSTYLCRFFQCFEFFHFWKWSEYLFRYTRSLAKFYVLNFFFSLSLSFLLLNMYNSQFIYWVIMKFREDVKPNCIACALKYALLWHRQQTKNKKALHINSPCWNTWLPSPIVRWITLHKSNSFLFLFLSLSVCVLLSVNLSLSDFLSFFAWRCSIWISCVSRNGYGCTYKKMQSHGSI